ncbi:Hypothetical predicted protein [Lecanosticta acicola]|uniref:Uncharacterized protein n=1 Tax=Lecanosticta acicola TaxID=111012 RepID=A0AAI8YSJ8_9PEZI|nr:Hypothetical predicted protein [Lecanosticta acicola]
MSHLHDAVVEKAQNVARDAKETLGKREQELESDERRDVGIGIDEFVPSANDRYAFNTGPELDRRDGGEKDE